MTTPQTRIQRKINDRVKALGLKQGEVAARVNDSDLYGEFTHGTFRNLVTWDFECDRKPRTTFNKQLIIALSEALECHVSDLASDYELSTIRDLPYRRNQWPENLIEEQRAVNPKSTVTAPKMTAARIVAYANQHAYHNATDFADALKGVGYRVSSRRLRHVFDYKNAPGELLARIVTFELCEYVARVFQGRMRRERFDTQWILTCQDRCPHCDPRLISY